MFRSLAVQRCSLLATLRPCGGANGCGPTPAVTTTTTTVTTTASSLSLSSRSALLPLPSSSSPLETQRRCFYTTTPPDMNKKAAVGKRRNTSAASITTAATAASSSSSSAKSATAAAAAVTAAEKEPASSRAKQTREKRQKQQKQQFAQFQMWQRDHQKKDKSGGGGGTDAAGGTGQKDQQQRNTVSGATAANTTTSSSSGIVRWRSPTSAIRAAAAAAAASVDGGAAVVDEVAASDARNDAVAPSVFEMDPDDQPELAPTTGAEAFLSNEEADELELAAEVTAEAADDGEELVGTDFATELQGREADRLPNAATGASASADAGEHNTNSDNSNDNVNDDDAASMVPSASTNAPAVGSLLDFESSLNLRLATLTRNTGKAFRAIAVYLPTVRTTMNFTITFEDISSGARLVCSLKEVPTLYAEWVRQFRAAYLALFLPTLQHPSAALLLNTIAGARAATQQQQRPLPTAGSYNPRLFEEPDHLFFSYQKLREIISKKPRDTDVNPQLLTVAVLNAYAEEWKNYITAPLACSPANFIQATFNFQPCGGGGGGGGTAGGMNASVGAITLNKDLLHAQLAGAAEALVSASRKGVLTVNYRSTSKPDNWSLIFVSAPPRTVTGGKSAVPPMQDLLTGQFVEPLSLSERFNVYIIGTGGAAASFAAFPTPRKGAAAYSILLQDIESQLHAQRGQRNTLTTTLARAVDSFSRVTWMSLMKAEDGTLRVPHPPTAFYRLQRRSVQREIVPSFLEAVFSPANRLMGGGGGGGQQHGGGGGGQQHGGGGGAGGGHMKPAAKGDGANNAQAQNSRRLEEHTRLIYNNPDRLETEQKLRDRMRGRTSFFVNIETAGVTAARRADNPFSCRNGLVDVSAQLWSSLSLPNPPEPVHLKGAVDASGATRVFVSPDDVVPVTLPTKPRDHANPRERAENAVIIAWDVKRVLLFLRESGQLKSFLSNGGTIWCAQYAQYLLKGFNHVNLATMERTLLQYHDGPLKTAMPPLAKLKLIFETQLDVAVNTRQLNSIVHRMDGLLAATEMEINGLQLAPQGEISRFATALRVDRERLEKVLQEKILDFTKSMDDEVRQRINFRSPQDISTIIYGGALCRHLGSRFVPVRPTKYPITALFPHAACHATAAPVPQAYLNPESLLGSFQTSASATGLPYTPRDVDRALVHITGLCQGTTTIDRLVGSTGVVVVTVKAKLGGLLEQISIYVPATTEAGEAEIKVRVAIDEILPVAENPDIVTVSQLKRMLATYEPLKRLAALMSNNSEASEAQKGSGGGGGRKGAGGAKRSPKQAASTTTTASGSSSEDLRNLLIVTTCSHDRLEPIVDTGIVDAIARVVLGRDNKDNNITREMAPFERVCFTDLGKAFPAAPAGSGGGGDSFESDFSDLSTSTSVVFSAKANWDSQTSELIGVGGVEGVVKAMVSHCTPLLGTPRDPFRSPHPVPSAAPQGLHGQEQAATPGMLWTVTPPSLHPVLRRFLFGRSPSSGADAMERVTVFLSPYSEIDLSFFSALQQLRYTEKKLQLFEEGALFRAVLPECMDRVHGELCHCVTATGRLSSQSPNLQNIPREEDLRTLIRSRFGSSSGRMIEADYGQLEVVVLAALSRDPQMMQELRDQVDFHCLRVSLMTKEPYDDVVRKARKEKDPHYIQLRQQAKVFSFQRQYGAGVATIATTTGLTEQEVETLIAAEESHYKELGRYYRLVMDSVAAGSDRLLRLRTLDTAMWNAGTRRIVMLTEPLYYFAVPTGSKFDFAKDRTSVPRLKNYPVQGLAGEIVQIICGKIIRMFYEKKNYGDKAFLVNTVHDCVWVDAHESVEEEVKRDIQVVMGNTQKIIGDLWPEMGLDVPFKVEIHSGTSLGAMSS